MLYNFTLKNCVFVETSMVKSSDKSKYVYSGYGIACDRAVRGALITNLVGML